FGKDQQAVAGLRERDVAGDGTSGVTALHSDVGQGAAAGDRAEAVELRDMGGDTVDIERARQQLESALQPDGSHGARVAEAGGTVPGNYGLARDRQELAVGDGQDIAAPGEDEALVQRHALQRAQPPAVDFDDLVSQRAGGNPELAATRDVRV